MHFSCAGRTPSLPITDPTLTAPALRHGPVAPRFLRPSAPPVFVTCFHDCRLQVAAFRPRSVCSRADIEPDNDHADTPATPSIDGLFFLSFNAPLGPTPWNPGNLRSESPEAPACPVRSVEPKLLSPTRRGTIARLTEAVTSGKFPPMKAVRADIKRRVVIPGAKPGDIFDVQRQSDERFVLVRLHRANEAPGMSREACLEAMNRSPLNVALSWEQLRRITREP